MKRITKAFYESSNGRTLISIRDGKAFIEYFVNDFTPDELDELALACHAAKEELLATTHVDWTDGVKVVTE